MICFSILLFLTSLGELGEEASNLDVFRHLALRIGEDLGKDLVNEGLTGAHIQIESDETAYLGPSLVVGLRAARFELASDSSVSTMKVRLIDAGVEYLNQWRDGLFGQRLVERHVRVSLSFSFQGELTSSGRDIPRSLVDTIRVSEIDRLESSHVSITRGVREDAGFLDSWVEPLVVVAAVAVGIYLLFAVRS